MTDRMPPVFRFAPSPNGLLHLGHAYSALLNFQMAQKSSGTFLLRIEDIDTERCRPELEAQMLHDLEWLGIEWDAEPRRQSDHFDDYADALAKLEAKGIIYPAFMSRSEIRRAIEPWGISWQTDPDGVPLYPGEERDLPLEQTARMVTERERHTKRLHMGKACAAPLLPLSWQENGAGPDGETGVITARPEAWGDVVIARSDTPTSYHLAVVVDDALQGVTTVVRGQDLFHSTSVHRLLQTLLELPEPAYHHHRLITDENGNKLSKSRGDISLKAMREAGKSPDDIKRMIGFHE
ncbi:tRNA glutamyl-Q(34) synthetase GluQRS [Pseudahrensia aquimaris]|uniref:tRNA glutamyl-Q(34) synthetase GluQRS n=1 Tax=Pseudahrensia aquimaris TaxID=744461 RepID=A0ABW3FDT9_9HYPH